MRGGQTDVAVAVIVAFVVLVVLALAAGVFWLRLRTLGRRAGSFPCAIQTPSGWTSGIACYAAGDLRWFRVVSLSPSPRYVWSRRSFAIVGPAVQIDADELPAVRSARSLSGRWLVEIVCRVSPPSRPDQESSVTLAVSAGAYAGLASWLESAPPGLARPLL